MANTMVPTPAQAPVAAQFPDAEAVVGTYLSGRPEMTGVSVGATLPTGYDGTTPAVVLIRDGGSYREDEVLDDAQVRIETYGPTPTAAHELMRTVRALLAGITHVLYSGYAVSGLSEETGLRGLRRLTDRANPALTRYVLNIRLLIRVQ